MINCIYQRGGCFTPKQTSYGTILDNINIWITHSTMNHRVNTPIVCLVSYKHQYQHKITLHSNNTNHHQHQPPPGWQTPLHLHPMVWCPHDESLPQWPSPCFFVIDNLGGWNKLGTQHAHVFHVTSCVLFMLSFFNFAYPKIFGIMSIYFSFSGLLSLLNSKTRTPWETHRFSMWTLMLHLVLKVSLIILWGTRPIWWYTGFIAHLASGVETILWYYYLSPSTINPNPIKQNSKKILTHTIHVWFIYLHLGDFYGKCR